MKTASINTWKAVEAEILSRIHTRKWKPGDFIPNEAELALEFSCARTTVNRALRSVAEKGLLDRRRKAGTRVSMLPIRKATLSIPVIRQEIEDAGHVYSYEIVSSKLDISPATIRSAMGIDGENQMLHHQAVHKADGRGYVASDRWINIQAVPAILEADLKQTSANEWLIANAPFTSGTIAFSATVADASIAERLQASKGSALFVIDRVTFNANVAITAVKLTFHPGYEMQTSL